MLKNRSMRSLRRVCLPLFFTVMWAPVVLVGAQPSEKATSFPDFLRAVHNAQAKNFVGKPGVAVVDNAAFGRMKSYILKLYAGVHVHRSFRAGAQTIDCVPEKEQPSLRAPGTNQAATAPLTSSSAPSQSKEACDAGTIPMRRITLDEVTRFRTLDDYLHKAPHGRAP